MLASRLMARYEMALVERPIPTKMATGGILWSAGDIVAQAGGRKEGEEFNRARLLRALVYGTLVHAPIAHIHYEFLEALVRRFNFSKNAQPLVKLIMEQFVYWSWASNALYHFGMAKMEGFSIDDSVQRVKDRLWPTMKAQWAFWLPVQYINFKVVPVRHQLNVVLLTSVVWTAALSFFFNKEQDQTETAQSQTT